MFDLVADYPVDVINWADRVTAGPTLAQARQMTNKALAGGLTVETLLNGTAEDVRLEVGDALAQTGGRGFMLTPSCTINARSPEANLHAARQAVEEMAG
jgi:uroporphyrinogen decarboxylase